MKEAEQLSYIYTLKHILRVTSVKERYENSAEHSWSTIMLAQHFLKKSNDKTLDELKIIKLLLFHDVVEIEAGDTPEISADAKEKKERELKAFKKILKKLPPELKEEYKNAFYEFEEGKTKEARYAKAIDKLDPFIQEWPNIHKWNSYGYDEKTLDKKKGEYFKEFPEIYEFFLNVKKHLKKKGIY